MTNVIAPRTEADAGRVLEILAGVTRYWVVAAALEVGAFESLAAGDATTTELAARCNVAAAPLGVICDVLADSGLLACEDGAWTLSPTARAHLVPEAQRPLDRLLVHGPGIPANLMALGAITRGASPPQPVEDDDDFWRDMFEATFPTQRRMARAIAETLSPPCARILEVGPCAGAWAIELLAGDPRARAAVQCRRPMQAAVAAAAMTAGVIDRLATATDTAAAGTFDLLVVANALRLVDAEDARRLMSETVKRAKPGATVVVADYFVDAPGRAGSSARLMAVTVVANTRTGGALRADDVCGWLAESGCGGARLVEPIPGFAVVIAQLTGEVT